MRHKIEPNFCDLRYKQKSLGKFINKKDAIVARLKAEKEYFGEFAPQRRLFEEYGIEYFEED